MARLAEPVERTNSPEPAVESDEDLPVEDAADADPGRVPDEEQERRRTDRKSDDGAADPH